MMLLPSISRAIARHPDVRFEPRRQVDELRRRPGMHAELVHDGHATREVTFACVFSPRRKSEATQMALRPCSRISFATASRSDDCGGRPA